MSIRDNKQILQGLCDELAASVQDLHAKMMRNVDNSAFLQCVHKVTESLAGLGKFVQGLPNLSKAFLSKVNTLRNVVVGMIQELKGVQQQQVMPPETKSMTLTKLRTEVMAALEAIPASFELDAPADLSRASTGTSPSGLAVKIEQTFQEMNRGVSARDRERFSIASKNLGELVPHFLNVAFGLGTITAEEKAGGQANLQQLFAASNALWDALEDPAALQGYKQALSTLEGRVRKFLPSAAVRQSSFEPERSRNPSVSRGGKLRNFKYVDPNTNVLVTVTYTPSPTPTPTASPAILPPTPSSPSPPLSPLSTSSPITPLPFSPSTNDPHKQNSDDNRSITGGGESPKEAPENHRPSYSRDSPPQEEAEPQSPSGLHGSVGSQDSGPANGRTLNKEKSRVEWGTFVNRAKHSLGATVEKLFTEDGANPSEEEPAPAASSPTPALPIAEPQASLAPTTSLRFMPSHGYSQENKERTGLLVNTPRRRFVTENREPDSVADTGEVAEGGSTPGLWRAESSPPSTGATPRGGNRQRGAWGTKRSPSGQQPEATPTAPKGEQEQDDEEEEASWEEAFDAIDTQELFDCDIDFVRLISQLTQSHCPGDWEGLPRRSILQFEKQINMKLLRYKECFLDDYSGQIAKMKLSHKTAEAASPSGLQTSSGSAGPRLDKKKSAAIFGYKLK